VQRSNPLPPLLSSLTSAATAAMTLTRKQQAAVSSVPPARRAALRATFNRQNPATGQQPQQRAPPNGRPRQRPAPANQRTAPKALARIPRPLPSGNLQFAFNAFDKRHLPLDELTAPYTTTNFIGVMPVVTKSDQDQIIVVCPRFMQNNGGQEFYAGPLSDYIAMKYDANETVAGTIPTTDSLRSPIIDMPAKTSADQFTSVRARLHNLSVKVECLGTSSGLYPPGSVYIGTVPCIETGWPSKGAAAGLTIKTAWADDSIAVGYLKSFPAASLIERPAFVNSAVAENVSYKSWRDLAVPSSATDIGSLGFSTALEPIVLYFPRCGHENSGVDYRVVIGQQWCSRHPHNVMLRSTQKQHTATPPSLWHSAISAVKDVGPMLLERAGGAAIDAIAARITRGGFGPQQMIANVADVVD